MNYIGNFNFEKFVTTFEGKWNGIKQCFVACNVSRHKARFWSVSPFELLTHGLKIDLIFRCSLICRVENNGNLWRKKSRFRCFITASRRHRSSRLRNGPQKLECVEPCRRNLFCKLRIESVDIWGIEANTRPTSHPVILLPYAY